MRRQSAMHACMTHLAMPDRRCTLNVQFRPSPLSVPPSSQYRFQCRSKPSGVRRVYWPCQSVRLDGVQVIGQMTWRDRRDQLRRPEIVTAYRYRSCTTRCHGNGSGTSLLSSSFSSSKMRASAASVALSGDPLP